MGCNCGKNKKRPEPPRTSTTAKGNSEPTPAAPPANTIQGASIMGVDRG